MTDKVTLFIIDPQVDFCDPTIGSLYVAGADKDMTRLSAMVRKNIGAIDDIHLTIDSHNLVHIAHAIWWVDQQGNHPGPFTLIDADSVRKGKWRCVNPGFQKRSLEYVETLEKNGRYVLCIWPNHCIIGSVGQTIVPELFSAVTEWENQFAIANKVTKGSNPFTEHYSAVRADVVDPEDAGTMLNERLIKALKNTGNGKILIAGEALSHCVANTIRDVANEFSTDEVKKFVLLEDACSNVTGFEKMGQDFINDMVAKGMQISTTEKFFA